MQRDYQYLSLNLFSSFLDLNHHRDARESSQLVPVVSLLTGLPSFKAAVATASPVQR
jgi:hypothetical protein